MASQVMATRSAKAAVAPRGFSGCAPTGANKHGIEPKRRTGGARHGQVAEMGRVKAAAEERDADGLPLLVAGLMRFIVTSRTRGLG